MFQDFSPEIKWKDAREMAQVRQVKLENIQLSPIKKRRDIGAKLPPLSIKHSTTLNNTSIPQEDTLEGLSRAKSQHVSLGNCKKRSFWEVQLCN